MPKKIYVGLIDYTLQNKAVTRYRLGQGEKTAFADNLLEVTVKDGQDNSVAIKEAVENKGEQYKKGWQKSLFASFTAEQPPAFDAYVNARPTPNGGMKGFTSSVPFPKI